MRVRWGGKGEVGGESEVGVRWGGSTHVQVCHHNPQSYIGHPMSIIDK